MCALGTIHWVLCTQVGIIRRRPASIHICLPCAWKSLPRSVTCNFLLLHARPTLIAFPLHICVSLLICSFGSISSSCTSALNRCRSAFITSGAVQNRRAAFYDFVCASAAMERFGTILLFLEVAVLSRQKCFCQKKTSSGCAEAQFATVFTWVETRANWRPCLPRTREASMFWFL